MQIETKLGAGHIRDDTVTAEIGSGAGSQLELALKASILNRVLR